jgi:hypothetical protein
MMEPFIQGLNNMVARLKDAVIKTNYSGFFSVSFKPYRPPKHPPMGLAVRLSGTEYQAVDSQQKVDSPTQDIQELEPTKLSPVCTGHKVEVTQLQPADSNQGLVTQEFEQDTPKPKTVRRPRGSSGLTKYAKHLLVGAVNLLETDYGKHNLVFHTATLPTDKSEIKREALRRSKQILQYWRKVLSRLLAKCGLSSDDIVIVLELQKRGAIHFHTVFVNPYRHGKYAISLKQLDNAWRQALTAILPILKDADFKASCRTERVKKSAGRYLAKYLSKGTTIKDINFSITWYSVGDSIKQRLKDRMDTFYLQVHKNFNFEQLAEALVSDKLAWCIEFWKYNGEIRSLFGYFDHCDCNFMLILRDLVKRVSRLSKWSPASL